MYNYITSNKPKDKFFWPGAESHDSFTDIDFSKKKRLHEEKTKNSLFDKNMPQITFSSESHSDNPIVINQQPINDTEKDDYFNK